MDELFSIDVAPDVQVRKQIRKKGKKPRTTGSKRLERTLAAAVFGDAAEPLSDDDCDNSQGVDKDAETEQGEAAEDASNDASEDEDGDEGEGEGEGEREGEGEESNAEEEAQPTRQAAWIDRDDEELSVPVSTGASRLKKLRKAKNEEQLAGAEYVARLRAQFASVQPEASWAALPGGRRHQRFDGDADEAEQGANGGGETEEVLRSAGAVLGQQRSLPQNSLSVRRMANLNAEEPNQSVTHTVQWHPNGQLALTAGPDQTVRLFRVDGTSNLKIQAVHIPQTQIASAAFTPDGAQILICGQNKNW